MSKQTIEVLQAEREEAEAVSSVASVAKAANEDAVEKAAAAAVKEAKLKIVKSKFKPGCKLFEFKSTDVKNILRRVHRGYVESEEPNETAAINDRRFAERGDEIGLRALQRRDASLLRDICHEIDDYAVQEFDDVVAVMRAAGIKKRVGKNQHINKLYFRRWQSQGKAQLICQLNAKELAFITVELNLAVCADVEALIASYASPQGGLNASKLESAREKITNTLIRLDWAKLAEQIATLEYLRVKLYIYPHNDINGPAVHLRGIKDLLEEIQRLVVDTKLIPESLIRHGVSYQGRELDIRLKTSDAKNS